MLTGATVPPDLPPHAHADAVIESLALCAPVAYPLPLSPCIAVVQWSNSSAVLQLSTPSFPRRRAKSSSSYGRLAPMAPGGGGAEYAPRSVRCSSG